MQADITSDIRERQARALKVEKCLTVLLLGRTPDQSLAHIALALDLVDEAWWAQLAEQAGVRPLSRPAPDRPNTSRTALKARLNYLARSHR